MLKQTPSSNQRPRGFKVKHVLQIFVLFVVCIWLIYQVKHFYDKKAFEDSYVKLAEKAQIGNGLLKLGRKGTHHRVDGTAFGTQKRGEEKEDEESKLEEKEDEASGGSEDELDGHDKDAAEEEKYVGQDPIDEDDTEKLEESEEKEIFEDASSLDDQEHKGVEKSLLEGEEKENADEDELVLGELNKQHWSQLE